MSFDFTPEKKVMILHNLYKGLDDNLEFHLHESKVEELFGVDNLELEQYLHSISSSNDCISFGVFSEGGFEAELNFTINSLKGFLTLLQHEHHNILIDKNEEIKKLNLQIEELEIKVKDILSFNPDKLEGEIDNALSSLSDVEKKAEGNEHLTSLLSTIVQIKSQLVNVKSINQNYAEIYKHIIMPIENQSKKSAKQTALWGIGGIIVTTIISIILQFFWGE